MHFAIMLSNDYSPDFDARRRVEDHVARADAARSAGFDGIACSHRYSFGPARPDERGEPITTARYQPLLLLSHLAGIFGSSLSYASTILLSASMHPVQLAEDVATLDHFCHGRLRVGVGLGWLPYELEAFGVERKRQVSRFEELLPLVRQFLAGEEVDVDGEHFTFRSARMAARPVQQPTPPIWVGASADAAVRRAARLGDSWVISSHSTMRDLARQNPMYLAELDALGLTEPAERPMNRMVYVAEDRATALRDAKPAMDDWYAKRRSWGWDVGQDSGSGDLEDEVFSTGRWLIGSPDDCVEQIMKIREVLGINHLTLAFPKGVDNAKLVRTIELLGERVIPRVRSLSA